ncbi:hypothetical protein V1512DRAFT_233383 [Lipomyces arxii]|uniref:uncharacterized protein n=1 Tax=Lipomyces arxii TaxID=56418 RepID=UPI0034CD2950
MAEVTTAQSVPILHPEISGSGQPARSRHRNRRPRNSDQQAQQQTEQTQQPQRRNRRRPERPARDQTDAQIESASEPSTNERGSRRRQRYGPDSGADQASRRRPAGRANTALNPQQPDFIPQQQQQLQQPPKPTGSKFKNRAMASSFGSRLTVPNAEDESVTKQSKRNIPTASLDLTEYFYGFDMSNNSLAASILQEIHSCAYECMICINSINRKSRVWTCDTCYRVFHINCIQKWANQLKKSGVEQTPSESFDSQLWRCPGCQTARAQVPDRYKCWCGKTDNPDQSPLFPPHSCGQSCAAEYTTCPHVCQMPCHPGPHPKCQAMGPRIDCFCGKSGLQRKCVETSYDGWSCGVVCGEMMACGVHRCSRPCHTDLCGPCQAPIHSSCYCGKEDKDVKCFQTLPAKRSTFIDEDGDEAYWIGIWKCDNVCGRYYDCEDHQCKKECHPQVAESAHCPLSPDVILTCPCGKHTISDILGHQRVKCTDPIPTCTDPCGKELVCGHPCKQICHTGDCGPCLERVTVPCLCEHTSITVHCCDLAMGPPRCEHVCRVQLNCQRHECGATCCAGEKAGLERMVKQRRKENAYMLQHLEDYIEPEHLCTQNCNRPLKCGNHMCQITCHRGPCPPCLEASFDELTCNCGRTKIMPPIPCGAKPPKCSYPCTRPKPCGHPLVPHNCHMDDEQCPKCPYFVERECMCGKKVLKNQPCSREQVSCGQICSKLLACGSHFCKKPCHHEGQCENPCKQLCGKTKSCGHPDEAACHSPFECQELKPCPALITISCQCGNLTVEIKCNATKSQKSPKRELKCNDHCALLARNNRLAEALQINQEARAEATPVHSEICLRLYSINKKWCESIEKIVDSFVIATPPKRSLAFPPMKSTQRQFIHTLAEVYNLESEAQDPEPHRSVVLHRTSRTALPDRNLAQSYAILQKTKAQEGVSMPSSGVISNTGLLTALRRAPKQAYNAIVLESVQIGLMRMDLERKLEPLISEYSQLKFTVQWIADEDVLLQPKPSSLAIDQVEAELAMLKPIIRRFVVLKEHLAEVVELCWVNKEGAIAYRERDKSTSVTPTPSSSTTSLVTAGRFAAFNQIAKAASEPVASLSAPTPTATVAAAKKVKKEPIAESWEDLNDESDIVETESGADLEPDYAVESEHTIESAVVEPGDTVEKEPVEADDGIDIEMPVKATTVMESDAAVDFGALVDPRARTDSEALIHAEAAESDAPGASTEHGSSETEQLKEEEKVVEE